jgi:hypothetical protein
MQNKNANIPKTTAYVNINNAKLVHGAASQSLEECFGCKGGNMSHQSGGTHREQLKL